MRIALVGSWKNDQKDKWDLKDEGDFAEACRVLGREIVRRNHQLIVGGQSVRTADYHAVEGAIQALGNSSVIRPPIVILRPNDKEVPYEDWRRKYPKLFTSLYSPEPTWQITKLFQVKHADAVLIVGGAKTSFQAGVAAAVSGRRIVPIGSFGGAGKKLLSLFQSSRGVWGNNIPTDEQLGSLHNPWTSQLSDDVVSLLRLSEFPRLLIIHGRSRDRIELKNCLQNILKLPEPVILDEKLLGGETLPQKFERLASQVDAAIALVTPDDIGGLADTADTEKRARQTVWIEVGWFWGRLGLSRVLLLRKDQTSIPSDLGGIETLSYQSNPCEESENIRRFIEGIKQ